MPNLQGFYIKAFMKGLDDYEKIINIEIEINLVATHGVVTSLRNSSTREPHLTWESIVVARNVTK